MIFRLPRFIRSFGMLILLTLPLVMAACAGSGLPAGISLPAATPTPSGIPAAQTLQPLVNPLPDRPVRFEVISIARGLSESVVNDIVQDRQGFLWLATQDGLNRFDGYNFTVYKNDPNDPNSLSHSHTTRVIEDRQGRLWVGTFSAGLNRFDPVTGRFTRYRPDPNQPGSLAAIRVDALLEDHAGTIWVGTHGGGLDRYDPQKDAFEHYRYQPDDPGSLSGNRVLSLLETRDGTLWVGTGNGLNRFDRASGKFIHYQNQVGNANSLSNNIVYSLAEDYLGRLWIGTYGGGLDRFEPAAGRFTHFTQDPADPRSLDGTQVLAVHEDRAGVLWAGVSGSGLCRLDADSLHFTCFKHDPYDSQSLGAGDVLDLYEDRAGVLWVGTYGSGLNRLDAGYKRFTNLRSTPQDPNSLGGNMIFAVTQDAQGALWVGSENGGLDRVDGKTGQVTHFRSDPTDPTSLSSDKVHALFFDHMGELWVGTAAGLDRLEPGSAKFTHQPYRLGYDNQLTSGSVTALREDNQGGLWIGGESDGIHRLDLTSGTFKHYNTKTGGSNRLASNNISVLYFDSTGVLWIGTQNQGLDRFDPRTETFTHFPNRPDDPTSLSDMYVLAVFEDSTGTLWVGTTAGLNRFDRASGTFHVYHSKDGLPNDVIYAILGDRQGRLWMSTNKGLARFDPKTGTFKNFDVQDGLQSNEFNNGSAFAASDGKLAFGGVQGLTVFYPDQIQDNPYIPPVVLTSLAQHGKPLLDNPARAAEITLRWPENSLDFEFAALNYTRPEDNRYAYRLEGFDRAWNAIGTERSGRYTNLPGGTYTLRLKGSNDDGLWNEAGAAIRVRVIPPWWETWWFRGGALVLILGVVLGGVRLRERSMESRNRELERLVQARTVEIQQLYEQTKELAIVEERNRLARDLHDSAKQKAFAALAQMGAANGLVRVDPNRAHAAMREAETLVYEVIEELTFLIQEMYPVALKEKGLATVLREYIFEWESRSEIQVDVRIDQERRLPLQMEQALYRITQEALANVARHSHAVRVEVTVEYRPDEVNIFIADNGQGFSKEQRPAGVGLRSMQERVAMIGGTLTIESAPGQGTRVAVCVPTRQLPQGD